MDVDRKEKGPQPTLTEELEMKMKTDLRNEEMQILEMNPYGLVEYMVCSRSKNIR